MILNPEYYVEMSVFVLVRWRLLKPILALNCRLQIDQVNDFCTKSDDGQLALVFRSLCFLSV